MTIDDARAALQTRPATQPDLGTTGANQSERPRCERLWRTTRRPRKRALQPATRATRSPKRPRDARWREQVAPFAGVWLTLIVAACGTEAALPLSPLDPPPEGRGFQLDEGAFVVEPGEEGLYCMRLPIPPSYGEAPVFVRQIESRLPPGTHHFFMAYSSDHVAAAEGCFPSGAFVSTAEADQHDGGGGKLMFLSGEGEYSYALPTGYAFYLPTGVGHMVTSHHVLNATDAPRDMFGVFNVHTVGADEITHPINQLNCLLQDIWIAPHSESTVSATCTAPFDLDLVVLSSHAHQHLRRFEMLHGDRVIYESSDWDSPDIVTLDEPLSLLAGEGLEFRCTFRNDGDEWIVFGTGDYGEMCAIMSQYAYPRVRPNDIPPSLGTIIYRDGHSAPLVETTDLGGPF